MTENEPVIIDAQVFLRIAKHAKQVFPSGASGTLMGIEEEKGLQVTSCFGYRRADPSAYEADAVGAKQSFQYEVDMIKLLGDVNLDAQSVGWYMTTHHGNLFNEALVEHQYVFQSQVPSAVCVVYDSFKTQVGESGFTAYRLTQDAMRQRATGEGMDTFAEFQSSKLFEHVPIKVYCSPYTEAFLMSNASKAKKEASGIELLTKSEATAGSGSGGGVAGLERNVGLLLETVEEFTLQQRETQLYERAMRQNKMGQNQRVPKSIDALNLTRQIQEHSSNLDSYCVNTFAKLYLSGEGKVDAPELQAMKDVMKN